MTTKKKISEQILRLAKGNPIISGRVHINDVKLLVEQVANRILKSDHFQVTLAEGDNVPDNCMIYTYDSVPVVAYKTVSKCDLPSFPINLPRNMGVFHVSKTDDISAPFIPIPSGLYGILKPQELLGSMSGLIGYEVFGRSIVFTQDLTALGITSVFMRLVGVDFASLTDYDPLPLSSDMEASVVESVYKILLTMPAADRSQNVTD